MGILDALGIVGGLASIAGLIYAIYIARKSQRVKLLIYDASPPVALASAVSPEDDYELAVIFRPKGGHEERIESVHVRFLRFANLGREPVRRDDIAPSNPLRVEVAGVRTLDISLTATSREVCRVELTKQTYAAENASAEIAFDFLDYRDGAVVKILTVGRKGSTALHGDIIGMPEGIRRVDQLRPKALLAKMGCALAASFELASVASVPFIFHWVTGAWTHVWLLILPFVALFAPAIIIAIIASTVWPEGNLSFPDNLELPGWARRLAFRETRMPNGPGGEVLLEFPRSDTEGSEAI
jgi:hypothetical protein